MAQDTTKIGLDEAEKIRRNALPAALKGIYRGKQGYGQKFFFFFPLLICMFDGIFDRSSSSDFSIISTLLMLVTEKPKKVTCFHCDVG